MKRGTSARVWVYSIWIVNGVVLLCLLAGAAFYFTNQTVEAVAPSQPSALAPTSEAAPTTYFLPTLTAFPNFTPYVFETSTPFVLNNGPAPTVIGYSVAGYPIEAYKFGNGEREYLIVAGIHGGYEWNTIALANELIEHLSKDPGAIPSDATLYIIRNITPDGEARAHGVDGRVNNNGVDLNRNFPSENWSADWDRDGCWIYRPTTGGLYGGSEPETRSVMSFIEEQNITALISYHSAALGVFPGGVPWTEESKQLSKVLAKATGYPYPPVDTGCVYTGTLADWAVENGVGAAVDMELRDHKNTDFAQNLKALKAFLNFIP